MEKILIFQTRLTRVATYDTDNKTERDLNSLRHTSNYKRLFYTPILHKLNPLHVLVQHMQ
jgi:transcriptional regulator of met regulon